jgi:exodeoxyribonuclease-3
MPTNSEREARRRRREAALALRPSMSPTGPADGHFRVATWNVNSLNVRAAALRRFLERTGADVLLLQETKSATISPSATKVLEALGYHVVHAGTGAYNGVAIASTRELTSVVASSDFGDEHLDREPRLISAVTQAPSPTRLVSVYVPHGREIGHWHYEYKLAFLEALEDQVARWLDEGSLIVGGDFNVAPTNSDVFHPAPFAGHTHVSSAEREALDRLVSAGLVDLDARRWGAHERRFTFWRHGFHYERNLGMRIDLLLADRGLAARLATTWIDHTERGGERPSDHAALLADFVADPSTAEVVRDHQDE